MVMVLMVKISTKTPYGKDKMMMTLNMIPFGGVGHREVEFSLSRGRRGLSPMLPAMESR
jgi:hypothetical protein